MAGPLFRTGPCQRGPVRFDGHKLVPSGQGMVSWPMRQSEIEPPKGLSARFLANGWLKGRSSLVDGPR